MPFRDQLAAQTTAFNHGCGLHCVAHAYVLNLKQGKFSPAEETLTLDVLLEAFKKHYPGARTLTREDLKDILIKDLQNPVHREVVLSGVLRGMIPDPTYHRPGEQVFDIDVQRIANRLGMKTESYTTLDGAARSVLRNQYENRELRDKTKADILAYHGVKTQTEFEALNLLAGTDHAPLGAPVLKLKNAYGGHWEWEYNIYDGNDEANRFACRQHDLAYPTHPMHYAKANASGVCVYGDQIHRHIDQAIENRAHHINSGRTLSDLLSTGEKNILDREKYEHSKLLLAASAASASSPASTPVLAASAASAVASASRKPASSMGTPADIMSGIGSFFNGLGGFFAPIFQALMPAFTANDSQPAMNTAIPVVGNVLTAVSNMLKTKDHKEADFDNDDKRTGHNGTKYKGSFFDLCGTGLGWVGSAFNFVGTLLAGMSQNKPKNAAGSLTEEELNTPEGELFGEYLRFLPNAPANIKEKLVNDFHNATIPRDKVFKDLRSALLRQGKGVEHDSLLFKQYLIKVAVKDTTFSRHLNEQYQRTHGDALAWDSLAKYFFSKGKLQDDSEVLSHRENRLLAEAFVAKGSAGAGSLTEAQKFYGATLNHFKRCPLNQDQINTRLDMIAAIKKGNKNDAKILAELQRIFSPYTSDGERKRDRELGDREGEGELGFDHASGSRPPIPDTGDHASKPRAAEVPETAEARTAVSQKLDDLLAEFETLRLNPAGSSSGGFMPGFSTASDPRKGFTPVPAPATTPSSPRAAARMTA